MAAQDDEYREEDGDSDEEVLSDDADVYQSKGGPSRRRQRTAQDARRQPKRVTGASTSNGNGTVGEDAVRRAAELATKARKATSGTKDKGYAWEATYKRSWDAVREDAGGSLAGAVRGLLEASKRRRTLHDSAPVQRGIIRHLILLLDLSESMLEKDLRPSRFLLTLQYAREFVSEFFDQNPIGQLSILATREGVAERITGMSGNTAEHIESLQSRRLTPKGEPSLQNALEMARSNLAHLPSANSREVLCLFGSLTTCDPGNIHETIAALAKDHVRVSMLCLAAEVKVCKEICKKTHGKFGVALDEGHLRDLLFEHVDPPEVEANQHRRPTNNRRNGAEEEDEADEGVELMQMGFPARLPTNDAPTLCSCHNRLKSGGYLCPRCLVKICDVPTDCPVCGLTVVMSTHLARSYHHLFPVPSYRAVGWRQLAAARMQVEEPEEDQSSHQGARQDVCLGCASNFEPLPSRYRLDGTARNGQSSAEEPDLPANVAASGRYECPTCHHHFCLECDSFVHESLHQCPGCH